MNKKQKLRKVEKSYSIDNYLIKLSIVTVILITLIVKYKVLVGYKFYDLQKDLTGTYNLFTYYKLVFLTLLVGILIALYLYRTFILKIKIRRDYVLVVTAVIGIAALISALFNPIGITQITGFYTRTNGLLAYFSLFALLYILSNLHIENKNLLFLVQGINVVSILLVIIGCFQFFGVDIYKADWYRAFYLPDGGKGLTTNSIVTKYSAASLLSHFNYYGAYCSIFFSLITTYAIKTSDIKNKVIFYIGSIALFVGALTSVSQGGLFTILIMLILLPIAYLNRGTIKIFAILYSTYSGIVVLVYICFDILTYRELLPKISSLLKNPKYLILLFVLATCYITLLWGRKYLIKNKFKVLVVVIVGCFVLMITIYMYMLNNVVEQNKGWFTNRGYAWHYTYQLLKDHFVRGYGPDNFYYAFPQDNPDASTFGMGVIFDKPHNMYLQTAMDTGIFGLIAFLGMLLVYMLKLAKAEALEMDKSKKIYLSGSFFVVIAYMIQGFVNDNHLVITPLLFTLLGVGMAVSRNVKLRGENQQGDFQK